MCINSDCLTRPGLRVKLTGRNCDALLPLLREFPIELLGDESVETPELVISSGGDGTLLGAERDYPCIPKFAIRDNANNPKCPEHGEAEQLRRLFSGGFTGQYLSKIEAEDSRGNRLCALNDIVLAREVSLGAIRYRVRMGGEVLRPQVISDSLVASTPFGSTGYFLSITRGSFRHGLGIAFNNSMDWESFEVLPESAVLDVELLRGPASVQADNNPALLRLVDGEHLTLRMAAQPTLIFGLEAFRCRECYQLRKDGVR